LLIENKMNILQIGTTDKRGGAAAVSWQLKKEAEKRGYKTSMFVADKLSDDRDVFAIPRKKIRRYLSFIFSVEDLYDTDWILKTEQFKNADIIHCHNLHGRFFKLSTLQKMSRLKPVVWTMHDEWAITPHCAYTYENKVLKDGFWECPNKNIPPRLLWHNEKYLRWRKKCVYAKSNLTVVTPSMWLKNRVSQSVLGSKNLKLIYNGINIENFKHFDKSESRKELNLPTDKKIALFLADGGSVNPFKGWEFVEKVIKNYQDRNDIIFLCVGGHEDYLADGSNSVKHIRHIDNQELLAKYYSAADFLLHSSIADNFPLVVLEAMSCGLPVVAFEVGGVPEVVTHLENGYIAKYKDISDLIKGVDYVINLSDGELDKISERSSYKIKNSYSVETMLENYFSLYDEEINKFKNKINV